MPSLCSVSLDDIIFSVHSLTANLSQWWMNVIGMLSRRLVIDRRLADVNYFTRAALIISFCQLECRNFYGRPYTLALSALTCEIKLK